MLSWVINFQPPKDATEALERAHEFAQDEARWTYGSMFHRKDPNQPLSCMNVSACAMGILMIACGDDAIMHLYKYQKTDEYTFESSVFRQATKLLAKAIPDGWRKSANDNSHRNNVGAVEDFNDGMPEYEEAETIEQMTAAARAHHQKIVATFAKAVELSKESS